MAKHLIASNATIKAIKPGDVRSRLLFVKGGSHSWRFDYTALAARPACLLVQGSNCQAHSDSESLPHG
jgi:hypothetical protein